MSRRVLLPNAILLIVLGIVCGPILGLFDMTALADVVPYLAPLTIAFIGFDAGLGMDLYEVLAQSRRAALLSILGFILSTGIVGLFLHFVFGLRWAYAFLLSSAWGGVSTATVNAVCKHLRIEKETATTLTLSSLIDDPIVLVSTLTILSYITLGDLGVGDISLLLVRNVSASIFLGVIFGLGWLNILYYSRKSKFTYTFTLAAVLLVYSATELLGGTGGIAIFVFGLILGNSQSLAKSLRLKIDVDQLSKLKGLIERFHSELTFILTTFFFVFIGLLYVWTGWLELLVGLAISLMLHGSRLVTVGIGTWRSSMAVSFPAIGLIVGKGVASAAMSTLPLAHELVNAELFSSIALNVILITNIISIALPILVTKTSKN
ncbi:MAG: cation:proton antiporter [Candidatus Bathyarchaeota archaeon]|nr:MAG: cation:proton antiporter [Candidatus Bathyarchaeota archaeon]